MTLNANGALHRRTALLAIAYALAFVFAAWLDLSTTALALTRAGASEGNVYATTADGYAAARAWLITGLGGVVVEGYLLFGALNAGKAAEVWLQRPIRSFAKFYINPFARGVIDRSPIHALSFVIAFVPLRMLAALNNIAIYATGDAPLGRLVGYAGRLTTPTIGFWLVMGTLFYLLAFGVSPIAASLIRWLRRPGGDAAGVETPVFHA